MFNYKQEITNSFNYASNKKANNFLQIIWFKKQVHYTYNVQCSQYKPVVINITLTYYPFITIKIKK